MAVALTLSGLSAISAACGANGVASATDATVEVESGPAATSTTVACRNFCPEPVDDIVPGAPVLVGSANGEQSGYVDWNEFYGPGLAAGEVLAVTDEADKLVGYFAADVGWIDIEQRHASGFDLDALRAEARARSELIANDLGG